GNRLLATMLLPYFNYNPARMPDPYHLVDTIVPAEPVQTGSLGLHFTGNRVDLCLEPFTDDTVKARILLDNYPPSSIGDIFSITRPNADSTKDWPWQTGAVIHTSNITPLTPERWTVRMTETGDSLEWFRFKIYGSITGYDGNGISTKKFISNSGKVIIEPEDWFVKQAWDMFKADFQPGYTITWNVRGTFHDYIDNSESREYTLIQGISNGSHYLQIMPYHHKRIPVEKIIVYKPFLISE
ncbi:MAG TPA: hypothetical protein VE870_09480, partial [Bacteroidales bacterium]|nr:hypothetical protein [Bacteroidales bacterium]